MKNRKHWRVVNPNHEKTSSLDSELQVKSLRDHPKRHFQWVTIARGNGVDLESIADHLVKTGFWRYMS